jgi:hypothetical protein
MTVYLRDELSPSFSTNYRRIEQTCGLLNPSVSDSYSLSWCPVSVVGIATNYELDDRGVGVQVPVGSRIFSSPRCQGRLWGPSNLVSNGYRGRFPWELRDWGVKLTAHLQLVPRSRKCGSIHPLLPTLY